MKEVKTMAAARLRHIAGIQSATRKSMNMQPLYQKQQTKAVA